MATRGEELLSIGLTDPPGPRPVPLPDCGTRDARQQHRAAGRDLDFHLRAVVWALCEIHPPVVGHEPPEVKRHVVPALQRSAGAADNDHGARNPLYARTFST